MFGLLFAGLQSPEQDLIRDLQVDIQVSFEPALTTSADQLRFLSASGMSLISHPWISETPLDSEVLSSSRTRRQVFKSSRSSAFSPVTRGTATEPSSEWSQSHVFPGVDGPVHVSLALGNAIVATASVPASETLARIAIAAKDLRAALGQVKLNTVEAESGKPLLGASTSIQDVSGWRRSLTRKDDGFADLQDVFPGPVLLRVEAPGYERFGAIVSVASGKTTELKDVRLFKSHNLHGRIVTSLGRPVKQTMLECLSAEELEGLDRGFVFREVATNDKGEFQIGDLGRRGYVLRIKGKFSVYPVPIPIEDIDRGAVEIALGEMVPVELALPASVSDRSEIVIRSQQLGIVAELDATVGPFVDVELPMGTFEARLVSSGRVVHAREFTAGNTGARVQLSK